MRFLKMLLKAAAISFALFAVGIVLAAVIYPDTDPPDWYSFAVVLVPFAVFIYILARSKPHTPKDGVSAPPSEPQTDQINSTDSEEYPSQYNTQSFESSPDIPGMTDFTHGILDAQDSFETSDYPADTFLDEDMSPDDDFVEEDIPQVEYPDFSGSFLHIAGLPLLIGTFCTVSHFSDHLYISSPKHRHTLSLDKILDVSILSYKDVLALHKQLLDSAASSPAFQALDETVKVSAKKKYLTPHTKFLVFSYSSSADAHSAIIFQLNDDNSLDAQKFVTGDHTYIRPKVEL